MRLLYNQYKIFCEVNILSNRHLNIFDTYTEKNLENPIENNLSRGYAILLQQYPEILYMLIDKINRKIRDEHLSFPYEEYDVEFQKHTKDVKDIDEIIGVTLTSRDLSKEIEVTPLKEIETTPLTGNELSELPDLITDISVLYSDEVNEKSVLIIIEAKRGDSNCVNQLNEQIQSCIKANGQENCCCKRVSLTWTEVIDMIESYNNLKSGRDLISCYYYDYIVSKYPEWTRVKKLNEIKSEDRDEINKRLKALLDDIKNKNDDYYFKDDMAIGIKNGECTERLVVGCYDDKKRIYLRAWPSNTKRQFYSFQRECEKWKKDGVSTDKTSWDWDIEIEPFIKFSHIRGKGILNFYFNKEKLPEIYNFMKDNTGKFQRKEWKKLLSDLENCLDDKDKKKLKKEFNELFSSNRTFFSICLSFRITRYIPLGQAKKLDETGKLEEKIEETVRDIERLFISKIAYQIK